MQKLPIIRIEGWRGISHSYSIVNQFQLIGWQSKRLAELSHIDMPFAMSHWSSSKNSAGFNSQDQELISSITEKSTYNYVYRIFAPFNLETPVDLPTLTFAVTEFGLSTENYQQSSVDLYASRGGMIHTPSHWSRDRLEANGIPANIIHVIPHGCDSRYFYPANLSTIKEYRQNLNFGADDIILLNIGTHHWNKGLDILIKCFALSRKKNKNLKLVLKDQRHTYLMDSDSFIKKILADEGLFDDETVASIRIISDHLELLQLNSLYNLADAYVTPYRAEGFNLPALEAQACGTPVIATAGGATDDFLYGSGYHPIVGKYHENSILKQDLPLNAYIEPDCDNLINILENISQKNQIPRDVDILNWESVCLKINSVFENSTVQPNIKKDNESLQLLENSTELVKTKINFSN